MHGLQRNGHVAAGDRLVKIRQVGVHGVQEQLAVFLGHERLGRGVDGHGRRVHVG
ncbi:hypothetical protein D3C71_1513170 [compost metagenome]